MDDTDDGDGAAADLTADELAGVLDLFGGLARTELARALAELTYRETGTDADRTAFAGAIDDAIDAYAVVRYEPDEGETDAPAEDATASTPLLVPGPTAFPTIPDGAEDLPHILDVPARRIDRAAAGRQAAERFRAETATAVADGNTKRMRHLLDVSYDLEAWAPVDLGDVRDRLDDALGAE